MKKYVPFIDLLDKNGYATGLTGKGVALFQYARNEKDSLWRKTNAAGITHSNIRCEKDSVGDERTAGGIGPVNYFQNFKYFMENVKGDKPFFFWYGANEPHRSYEQDSWIRNNKSLDNVNVPGFFPDHEIVRGDMLDYVVEIEWFDLHLQDIKPGTSDELLPMFGIDEDGVHHSEWAFTDIFDSYIRYSPIRDFPKPE